MISLTDQEHARACIAEGFCPLCQHPLLILGEADLDGVAYAWSPARWWCPSCELYIGTYPAGSASAREGDVHAGMGICGLRHDRGETHAIDVDFRLYPTGRWDLVNDRPA